MLKRLNQSRILEKLAFLSISIWGIASARDFLAPICFSALLAFLLTPGIRIAKKIGIPEGLSIVTVCLLFVLPLAAIAYETLAQGDALIQQFPSILETLERKTNLILDNDWIRRYFSGNLSFHSLFQKLTKEVGSSSAIGIAVQSVKTIFSGTGSLILVLFFCVLFLISRDRILRSTIQIIRRGDSAISNNPSEFVESVSELIQRFLLVRLILVLFVFGADWVICFGLGVPYALALALNLGVMTLIPTFGFIIGVLPPLLLASFTGFSFTKITVLFLSLFFISILEGNVLTPKLLGRHLNLNLLFTFLALFAGGQLWGPVGMFLSIPFMGVFRIILNSTPNGATWSQLMAERDELTPRTAKTSRKVA